MATSTRIKAQNIIFKIGSTDYACDANMVELTLGDAPGDIQTFCEVRTGGQWSLQLDGIISGDVTSLYRVLWDNFGTEVAFELAPNGNTVATPDQPIYEGVVRFNQLPPVSLNSNETATFSVTLDVVNTPHNPPSTWYGIYVATA